MKKFIISLIMVTISFSTFAKWEIPNKPNPPRLVNDYIHLLAEEEMQALETKLVEFEQKTSIQIAVVILDNLGNNEPVDVAVKIGQSWGVGHKGIDNGLVFLVVKYNQNALEKLFSSKSGDVYIATGYGLEPYLTDLETSRILDTDFIPFVKKGKYQQGIDATVNKIISKLGEIGWQQREELEARRKAENAEAMRKFGMVLLDLLLFGGIVFLLVRAYLSIKARLQKTKELKRLKNELRKNFSEQKKAYNEAKAHYDQLLKEKLTAEKYPDWADKKFSTFTSKVHEEFNESAQAIIERFEASNDLEDMASLHREIIAHRNLFRSLVTNIQALDNEVEKYRNTAPEKVKETKDLVKQLEIKVNAKVQKGFFLKSYTDVISQWNYQILHFETSLVQKTNEDRDIYEKSSDICSSALDTIRDFESYLSKKESTQQLINDIDMKLGTIHALEVEAKVILDELKKTYPASAWEELAYKFNSTAVLLNSCKKQKEIAGIRNDMKVQEFDSALSYAEKSKSNLDDVLACFKAIKARKFKLLEARIKYEDLLKQAEAQIATADEKILHVDVKEGTKANLVFAKNKLQDANEKHKNVLVDWLIIITLLSQARKIGKEVCDNADADISAAEQKRQKDIQIANAAALAAAQKKAKKEDDFYSSSRRSSNPSSSNDGFGGFGGGSFGGGGAGKSW